METWPVAHLDDLIEILIVMPIGVILAVLLKQPAAEMQTLVKAVLPEELIRLA